MEPKPAFRYVDAADLFEKMVKAIDSIPKDSRQGIRLNEPARKHMAMLVGMGLLKVRADGFYHIEDIIEADKKLEKLLGDEPTIS